MIPSLIVSFESADLSDIKLASLYWEIDDDGRWSFTVREIAEYLSLTSAETSKRVAIIGPAFLISRRCIRCLTPFKFSHRSEYSAVVRNNLTVCGSCHEASARAARDEEDTRQRSARQMQQAIWLRNTSIDPGINYRDLDYSDIIRAFAIFASSESDGEGNLRFTDVPPFSTKPAALKETAKSLYRQEVLLIGKGTPVNAFVPGDSVDNFSYYPDRVVWRFATLDESANSSIIGRELSDFLDNAPSDFDRWNSVAEIWWEVAYAEALRYLNEQLEKYGLQANEGDALKEAINHALDNFSIPALRNLLWKLAKDVGAYSAERGIVKPRAINAIPGKLIRMVDRYVANAWDVVPYVLRWDDEECLLITILFDRVLKTGVAGFKTLTGRVIRERRQQAMSG